MAYDAQTLGRILSRIFPVDFTPREDHERALKKLGKKTR
jgi:hypothetical protein